MNKFDLILGKKITNAKSEFEVLTYEEFSEILKTWEKEDKFKTISFNFTNLNEFISLADLKQKNKIIDFKFKFEGNNKPISIMIWHADHQKEHANIPMIFIDKQNNEYGITHAENFRITFTKL